MKTIFLEKNNLDLLYKNGKIPAIDLNLNQNDYAILALKKVPLLLLKKGKTFFI